MKEYVKALLEYVPEVREHSAYNPPSDAGEVRAVTFSLPSFFEKEYETFAYIGFPKTDAKKVPAVVLVHGGKGHAHHDWVRAWNLRGYAAIAMDMEGFYPNYVEQSEIPVDGYLSFTYGAYGPFVREGLENSPQNDAMQCKDLPLEKQWMFHCIAKVILAQNILRADDRIDKVGICGVSWGSIITSLSIGYDTRFDFAVSIYGGGYCLENKGFCGDNFRSAELSDDTYLAEKRFSLVKTPTLFLCGSADWAFSIDANSHSFEELSKTCPSSFAIVENFIHGQKVAVERIEPYLFADVICKEASPLVQFSDKPQGRKGSVSFSGEAATVKGYYITGPVFYDKSKSMEERTPGEPVKEFPCSISGNKVYFDVPEEAYGYYLTLCGTKEGEEYFASSPLIVCE